MSLRWETYIKAELAQDALSDDMVALVCGVICLQAFGCMALLVLGSCLLGWQVQVTCSDKAG